MAKANSALKLKDIQADFEMKVVCSKPYICF